MLSQCIELRLREQRTTRNQISLAIEKLDLINGRLVRPFPQSLPLSRTYWIICPKATATLPKIVTFRDWLMAEASRDLRQLQKKGWATR